MKARLSVIRIGAEGAFSNVKWPAPARDPHVTASFLPDVMFGLLAQALAQSGVPVRMAALCLVGVCLRLGGPGVAHRRRPADHLRHGDRFWCFHGRRRRVGRRSARDGLSATTRSERRCATCQ